MATRVRWGRVRWLGRAYAESMERRPYLTNMVTGACLWTMGDIIAQRLEPSPHEDELAPPQRRVWDWRRTMRMSVYGFCCAGPIYCWWYSLLDRRVAFLAGHPWRLIAAKVFADQCIFEPPYLVFFFTTTTFMEGLSSEQLWKKLRQALVPTYIVDCQVWPLAQVLNFRFVPVMYQALVVNCICVGWNAYLSWMKHRPVEPAVTLALTEEC